MKNRKLKSIVLYNIILLTQLSLVLPLPTYADNTQEILQQQQKPLTQDSVQNSNNPNTSKILAEAEERGIPVRDIETYYNKKKENSNYKINYDVHKKTISDIELCIELYKKLESFDINYTSILKGREISYSSDITPAEIAVFNYKIVLENRAIELGLINKPNNNIFTKEELESKLNNLINNKPEEYKEIKYRNELKEQEQMEEEDRKAITFCIIVFFIIFIPSMAFLIILRS